MVRLYLKIPENFVRLIFQDGFLVVYIPLVRMIKFKLWGCPRGVMVKAMDCRIVVREFVLQSRYYVHFRANTFGKGMNPLILK